PLGSGVRAAPDRRPAGAPVTRICRRLFAAALAAAAGCALPDAPAPERQAADLLPLPGPADGGTGPYALFVCATPHGPTGNGGGIAVPSAATLATALSAPQAAFDPASFPLQLRYVSSWLLPHEVNLWDGVDLQARGVFFADAGSPADDVSELFVNGAQQPLSF